jgi:uncharacterized protein YegP (UPF0339 family)
MPEQFIIELLEKNGEWTFRLHAAKGGVKLESFTESSRFWQTRNQAIEAGKKLAAVFGVPSFTA